MTIILYDIANILPGPRTISSNVWKTRLSLNYKGIPYRTEWLEVIDIEPTMKKLGASPTGKRENGSDRYTVPVIFDPKTSRYISDSWAIAEYLDITYPEEPLLFPPGTAGAIALLQHQYTEKFINHIFRNLLIGTYNNLNHRSQEYFRTTREKAFGGVKLEEISPLASSIRDDIFAKVKEGLDLFDYCFGKNGKDKGIFYLGDRFTYADCIVVAMLLWTKSALDAVGCEEWKIISKWNDGRWEKLIQETVEYQVTL